MLDVINQQGYQVVTLQQRLDQAHKVISLLAASIAGTDDDSFLLREDAADDIETVDWSPGDDGEILFSITRK